MSLALQIITYSTWGHLFEFAKHVQAGVESAGGKADIFRIPETLSEEVLVYMQAPAPPSDIPIATMETLVEYDAFLFGIPTRFGTLPAQFFDFFGQSGGLWSNGSLYHKPAGVFVSTGTPGGGQEVTVRNFLSILAHHGMIYVPLGYGAAFSSLTNLDEPHGSSPWGAGIFAGGDGSRAASELENSIAETQGAEFFKVLTNKFNLGKQTASDDKTTNEENSTEPSEEPVKPSKKSTNPRGNPQSSAIADSTDSKKKVDKSISDEKGSSRSVQAKAAQDKDRFNCKNGCCIIM